MNINIKIKLKLIRNKRWKLKMNKIKIKREEGPTRNPIWGILKYLSAEISAENC